MEMKNLKDTKAPNSDRNVIECLLAQSVAKVKAMDDNLSSTTVRCLSYCADDSQLLAVEQLKSQKGKKSKKVTKKKNLEVS